jgi:LysM repeat protein
MSTFHYTVKRGDTLSGLARTHGTTVVELQRLNPHIGPPERMPVGLVIRIPISDGSGTDTSGTGTAPAVRDPYRNQKKAGSRVYSLRRDGPDLELSDNFTLIEFASRDGADSVLLHPRLIELVQTIRQELAVPLVIQSGYRTPAHNAKVGGASNSFHTQGMAADVWARDAGRTGMLVTIETLARKLRVGGLKRYRTFVHVDVGPPGATGNPRTW